MKYLLSLFIFLGLSTVAMAKHHEGKHMDYGMAGCGWGASVMGKDGGQISAATTNGLLFNQAFAISFGTSRCVPGNDQTISKVTEFVKTNRLALTNDIARGQGETLANLSRIFGCRENVQLGKVLQENFESIFPKEEVDASYIGRSITFFIRTETQTANSCSKILS